MKPIYLDWNLGLGDALICNGLARWLSKQEPGRLIFLPCWVRNLPTVRHMFSDLAHVHAVQVADGEKPQINRRDFEVRSIGINNPKWGTIEPWDRAFYKFAGVPFDAKWDLFHVPESGSELQSRGATILGHDDAARGFNIEPGRVIRITSWICQGGLLTDWRNVIRDAKEIHCIDSAPMHLAELLPTTGKLFYHRYARPKDQRQKTDATFRKPWVVLE